MPENKLYPPEGSRPCGAFTLADLRQAQEARAILEGIPLRCDTNHDLHLRLGSISALLPRQEVVAPWISGAERDISAISRVGKATCFTVKSIYTDAKGAPRALLSRKDAQEQAMAWFLENLRSGSVITGRIIRLEGYGAFVDIGCGIVGLLPIERISVSRISHPGERCLSGQKITAVILHIEPQLRRVTLTHRELLGTWLENASLFQAGETVQGIVRSLKPYGAFIELTPNLSGLADCQEDLSPGDRVSVFIKSIRPESMKLKLQIVERLPAAGLPAPLHYQITDGILEHWLYSPPGCQKAPVLTDFTAFAP